MDPKNTDEASSSLPRAHEQDAPADPTAPSSSTLRRTSPLPTSPNPVVPTVIDCYVCRAQFNDFDVWFQHLLSDHPRYLDEISSPSPPPSPSPASPWIPPPSPLEREEGEIRCPLCSRTFLAHEDRYCAHVWNARLEEMNSSERICHLCGIRLPNPEEYKNHVWDVHTPIITIGVQPRRGAAADHQPSSSTAAVAARSREASSSTAMVVAPSSSSAAVAARSREVSSSTAAVAPSSSVEASQAQRAAEQAAKEEEFIRYVDAGGYINPHGFIDLNREPPSSPSDG